MANEYPEKFNNKFERRFFWNQKLAAWRPKATPMKVPIDDMVQRMSHTQNI